MKEERKIGSDKAKSNLIYETNEARSSGVPAHSTKQMAVASEKVESYKNITAQN